MNATTQQIEAILRPFAEHPEVQKQQDIPDYYGYRCVRVEANFTKDGMKLECSIYPGGKLSQSFYADSLEACIEKIRTFDPEEQRKIRIKALQEELDKLQTSTTEAIETAVA